MDRNFIVLAGIFGFLGVSAGAFGAHGLEDRLSPDMLKIWNTAAQYQLLHAVALLGAAWTSVLLPGRWTAAAGWLFVSGIVIFSGSLYLLAITGYTRLGAVTPIGGLALLGGWACLVIAAMGASGRQSAP